MNIARLFSLLFFFAFLMPLSSIAADTSHTMQVALRWLNETARSYETAQRALTELTSAYGGAANAPIATRQRLIEAEARALENVLNATQQALSEHAYQEMVVEGVFLCLVPLADFQYEPTNGVEAAAVSYSQEHESCVARSTSSSKLMHLTQQVAYDYAQKAKQAFEECSASLAELVRAYGGSDKIPKQIYKKRLQAKEQALAEWRAAQRQHLTEYAFSLRKLGE